MNYTTIQLERCLEYTMDITGTSGDWSWTCSDY